MLGQDVRDTEVKLVAILKELSKSSEPLGSTTITRRLKHQGIVLSERGVRFYLKITDARGYTRPLGRGGRMITSEGQQEIKEALVEWQLGFVVNKLKSLACQTTFNPEKRSGQLPINTSLIGKNEFKKALSAMKDAFKAGFCVSKLVAIALEGEKLGSVVIPSGKIGFATVCSVATNGVLLKAGVPVENKYRGILEIRTSQPSRFVAIIDYAGTSLDPSEQYIRSRMTSVGEASRTSNGRVLAVYRAIPAPARKITEEKIKALKELGIGGVYTIGRTSGPLFQISGDLNRIGIVQLTGLNPVAAAVEAGIEVENIAGSGLIDFQQLQPVWRL
jgi:repressor of nif and glnA expression